MKCASLEARVMARQRSSNTGLWDDLEGSIPIHSVGGKATAFQGENPVCFQLFAQRHQGSLRFKRLADRSSFSARSAGSRMLNCRSICVASLCYAMQCKVVQKSNPTN